MHSFYLGPTSASNQNQDNNTNVVPPVNTNTSVSDPMIPTVNFIFILKYQNSVLFPVFNENITSNVEIQAMRGLCIFISLTLTESMLTMEKELQAARAALKNKAASNLPPEKEAPKKRGGSGRASRAKKVKPNASLEEENDLLQPTQEDPENPKDSQDIEHSQEIEESQQETEESQQTATTKRLR